MRVLSILLFLGACGSVSLPTIMQLGRLTPLTADPSGFVAAVVLPDALDLPENSATLGFIWVSDTETIGGNFPLRRHAEFDGHGIKPRPEQQVLFFDLSPEDAAKIKQAQQDIIARKNMGVGGQGSFSVLATPCARGVLAQPLISTYLRIEDGGPFLLLLRDFDIRQEMTAGQLLEIATCG